LLSFLFQSLALTSNKILFYKETKPKIFVCVFLVTQIKMWCSVAIAFQYTTSSSLKWMGVFYSTLQILSFPIYFKTRLHRLALYLLIGPAYVYIAQAASLHGGITFIACIWACSYPMVAGLILGIRETIVTTIISALFLIVQIYFTLYLNGSFVYSISFGKYLYQTATLLGFILAISFYTILLARIESLITEHGFHKYLQFQTLIRVLVHDIASPLEVASQGLSLLQEQENQNEDTTALTVRRKLDHCHRTLESVRKLEALSSGKQNLVLEKMSLSELIDNSLKSLPNSQFKKSSVHPDFNNVFVLIDKSVFCKHVFSAITEVIEKNKWKKIRIECRLEKNQFVLDFLNITDTLDEITTTSTMFENPLDTRNQLDIPLKFAELFNMQVIQLTSQQANLNNGIQIQGPILEKSGQTSPSLAFMRRVVSLFQNSPKSTLKSGLTAEYKVRLFLSFYLVSTVLIWIYSLIAWHFFGEHSFSVFGLIYAFCHTLSLPLYFVTGSLKKGLSLALFTSYLFINHYSYFSSNLVTLKLHWLGAFPLLAGIILGYRESLHWVGMCLLSIAFHFTNAYIIFGSEVTANNFLEQLIRSSLSAAGILLITSIFTFEILKSQDKFDAKLMTTIREKKGLLNLITRDIALPIREARNKIKISSESKIGTKILSSMKKIEEIVESVNEIEQIEEAMEKTTIVSDFYAQPFNVFDAIEECISAVQERLHRKNLLILLDAERNIQAFGNAHIFAHQVFFNFLTNAIKFSSKGRFIFIEIENKGNDIIVHIRDQGEGMNSEIMAKIFDSSAKTTTKGTQGEMGTGFGMPIAHKFMKLMKGSITVESKSIKKFGPSACGTTFRLHLKKVA
jgi:signal transduction histidine kinase